MGLSTDRYKAIKTLAKRSHFLKQQSKVSSALDPGCDLLKFERIHFKQIDAFISTLDDICRRSLWRRAKCCRSIVHPLGGNLRWAHRQPTGLTSYPTMVIAICERWQRVDHLISSISNGSTPFGTNAIEIILASTQQLPLFGFFAKDFDSSPWIWHYLLDIHQWNLERVIWLSAIIPLKEVNCFICAILEWLCVCVFFEYI